MAEYKCQHNWKYLYDTGNADWCEEVYECIICRDRQYRELPD